MGKKDNKLSEDYFPKDYFNGPFPPMHNPLIGSLPADTFHNVHDAMSTLQELTVGCEQDELVLSEHATGGLFTIMECIIHALHFELYHRR